jgi:Transposase C of IS166 homeodomain
MQIDLDALPADAGVLQHMLREVVPELLAENEKLLRMVECLLRHRFGRRSEKLDLDQLRLLLEDAAQGQAQSEAPQGGTAGNHRTEMARRYQCAVDDHPLGAPLAIAGHR